MRRQSRNNGSARFGATAVASSLCFIIVAITMHSSVNAFVTTTSTVVPAARIAASKSKSSLLVMTSSSSSSPQQRLRKRDIIRKWGSSASNKLGINNNGRNKRLSLIPLASMSSPEQEEEEDNDNKNNTEDSKSTTNNALDSLKSTVSSKIPPKILEFFQAILDKIKAMFPPFASIKLALFSFFTGAVLMLVAILVPVYNQVETLTEPVTLFETILTDLDRGYVDQVDTNKLFETGVSAMLRSLDPYTEFETKQDAQQLSETIGGKYGGIGLVISGASPKDIARLQQQEEDQQTTTTTTTASPNYSPTNKLLPKDALQDQQRMNDDGAAETTQDDGDMSSSSITNAVDQDDDDELLDQEDLTFQRKKLQQAKNYGVRVVSAFEGYAFDYGMRVGDKLVAIDGQTITPTTSVDQVRNMLRGEPNTNVEVSFEREGVKGINTISMPRTIVRINDVKLASLLGKPEDGIGYIQLTGFAADAGQEVRQSILALQRAAEDASGGERSLQGLILDLRGNPGGLLTSAVDVSSLLVPKGSDIVAARGRGFPGVLYRSRVDPILDQNTKLAVLVNGGTASAAEIVSGAVQDLDVGIIVGTDRTFGKGLVQNVEDLPFNTALKFTVAKYYTPSGRCIQGINYKEGGGTDGKYTAKKVTDKDKGVFYTKRGREVRDGGGIEADYKVSAPKASALEVTLLRSGALADFAAQWSKNHELTNNFEVSDDTYREFIAFVNQKQKDGEIKLEAIYKQSISDLKNALKQSGYKSSAKELDALQGSIVREVQKDFEKYRSDIKEDISQSILARYLPESMLIERGLKSDKQVNAAVKLLSNGRKFDQLLARGSTDETQRINGATSISTASAESVKKENGARLNVKW